MNADLNITSSYYIGRSIYIFDRKTVHVVELKGNIAALKFQIQLEIEVLEKRIN